MVSIAPPSSFDLNLATLRATGAVPHYFGLGFIQLKLDARRRLHFWVPEWPAIPGADNEIHDHRYDFTSTVLQGEVEQEVFAEGPVETSPFPGCHELVEVLCQPGHGAEPPLVQGYVNPMRRIHHRVAAGQAYWLSGEAFHRARSHGATVTLLERGPVQKDRARVIRPFGTPFVCPFGLAVPEAACWEQIEQMIR